MDKNFNLIILGPQGSGKGTQAELLAKKINMKIIAPGEILRKKVKGSTLLGRKIKEYSEKGELVPDDIIKKLVLKKLEKIKKDGIIFDAFPRNIRQAKILEDFLKKFHFRQPILIYLKISRKLAISRITTRRICPKCKEKFYPKSKGYKKGICSKCNARIVSRKDDKPKIVKRRLEIYFSQTKKIIDYYKKQGRLIKIDGEPKLEEVFHQILGKLNDYFKK